MTLKLQSSMTTEPITKNIMVLSDTKSSFFMDFHTELMQSDTEKC